MAGIAVSPGERLRYVAYAALAVAAVAVYIELDQDAGQTAAGTVRRSIPAEGLPILQPLDTEAGGEARRDLFAFGGSAPAVEVVPAVEMAPVVSEPVQEKPDLLANVQAMGAVRQNDAVTVLVRVGSRLLTVGVGEPFGDGYALYVQSVQGRNVSINDKTSGASRTFHLSEE